MIKKINWYFLLLLAVILVVGIPSLFVDWLILDDGVMILISQKLSLALKTFNFQEIINLLIEKDLGRFRPAYWIYQWLVYLIAGINPVFQHLIHLIVNSLTVFLIYGIGRNFGLSKKAVFIGCLLFVMAPFNFEHWYRLGPVEPRIVFWLALSVFFLSINLKAVLEQRTAKPYHFFFSIFFLFLAYLTKETVIAIFPLSLLLIAGYKFLSNRKQVIEWRKTTLFFCLANFLFSLVSLAVVLMIKNQGSYSSNYSLDLGASFKVFIGYARLIMSSYGLFSLIFILTFLLRLRQKLSMQKFMQLIFLGETLFFIAIILPWSFPMARYLEPALLFLAIYFQFEAENFLELGKDIRKKFRLRADFTYIIFLIAFGYFLFRQGPGMLSQIIGNITDTRNTRALFSYIAANTPEKGSVYVNLKKSDATIEVVYESQLHLALFYNRPDLTVSYLDNENLKNLKNGDIVFNAFNRSDNYLFFLDQDLFAIKNLRIAKIIPNKYVTISSRLSFFKKVLPSLRETLTLPPFNLIEYSQDKRDFRIFQVVNLQ